MDTVNIYKFIALCLASAALQTASGCRLGWVLFQDSCYGFGNEAVTWLDAAAYCSAFGSHLVEINSQAENDWIVSQLQTKKWSQTWLGSSDLFNKGTFQWTTSGETMAFTNWNSGEPNNAGGVEHCIHAADSIGYKWNDILCSQTKTFVCEAKEGCGQS